LLAVHNCAEFLSAAIQSVLKQTYSNWELIIVENGSSDSTLQIARDYSKQDMRILCFQLPEKGKCAAYNLAFANCTGDFICYFAGDDLLVENSLEQRVEYTRNHPFNFSTCLIETISENPKYDGVLFPKQKKTMNFSGGALFFLRSLGERIFPIPVNLPNEDTWTMLHLKAFGLGRPVTQVLYRYRIHLLNSYGYDLSFQEKRRRFIERMNAYRLFKAKYPNLSDHSFIDYINAYIQALNMFELGFNLKILLLPHLPIRQRLVFIYFSSPLLYFLRNRFFRKLSGFFG